MVPLILGIPAIAGAIFMIYNMARFSGPLDFGNKWQTSARDVRQPAVQRHRKPAACVVRLPGRAAASDAGFPYFHLPPPPDAPLAGNPLYQGEPTASILWAVPFVLLALAFLARRRPAAAADDTSLVKPVVLTMLAIGMFMLLAGAYGVPGYTERYKLDFLPWIVIAATLGWAALIRHASNPRRASWWRRGGIALGAWGVLVGVAVSFAGFYNSFNLLDHGRFQSLERAFSPLPTLATKIAGRPMIASIVAPARYYNRRGRLHETGRRRDQLPARAPADRRGHDRLTEQPRRAPDVPRPDQDSGHVPGLPIRQPTRRHQRSSTIRAPRRCRCTSNAASTTSSSD